MRVIYLYQDFSKGGVYEYLQAVSQVHIQTDFAFDVPCFGLHYPEGLGPCHQDSFCSYLNIFPCLAGDDLFPSKLTNPVLCLFSEYCYREEGCLTDKASYKTGVRLLIDYRRCPYLADEAVLHDYDTVREAHRLHPVVGYIDCSNSKLLLDLSDLHAHLLPEQGVEV